MVRILLILAGGLAAACSSSPRPAGGPSGPGPAPGPDLRDPREVHLADLVQLSDGGENAEAYWSFDGTQLIFQTKRAPYGCDQIMRMPADGSAEPVMVSSGEGRTTCSYFLPGDDEVVYSSTHATSKACPPEPDRSQGYVWALYDSYDIYRAAADGSNLRKLTDRVGYDAEATVCGVDGSIVFTSDRDGDLELYRMDADGGNVVRLTHTPGYDGGAFFSNDCTKLVWRASRPTGDDLADYQRLLAMQLVRPSKLELYVSNADGTDARQVTYLDAASFGPYLFPSGDRIIFSSNYGDPSGREFDLWAINTDGTALERITHSPGFDGFPMFSPDGTRLAFASNRNNREEGETNMFVARWVDGAPVVHAESAADRFAVAVAALADDTLAGRGVGTDGLERAAAYLEAGLRGAGVEGGMPDGGFRQPFEVVTEVARGAGTALTVDRKAIAAAGFVPLTFSKAGAVTADTVYVGHGLDDGALGLHDYRGKQVKGKVVVVRRFVPDTIKDDLARHRLGDLHQKAITARLKGAVGMIVVDVPTADGEEAALPALYPSGTDVGIVAVAVTHEVGKVLISGKHKAALSVDLERIRATTDNVVGVIRAGAPVRRDGVIVIGAHYDHLGMGGPGSFDVTPAIHNGADDNASGVAALLEVARILGGQRDQLTRDLWLVGFSAEEMGLLGANHFVANPPGPAKMVAMLNMDMVGRMRDNRLDALGAESAAEWPAIVAQACAEARVRCTASSSGHGGSDHMAFYIAGVPVLHFFTGSHLDYHRSSDDAAKINAAGGAASAQVVAATARALGGRDGLTYQKAVRPTLAGDARSRGASLGTVPRYDDDDPGAPPGMVIADVIADGPAQRAGLRGGDRIVEIGDVEIRSVHELMYVLGNARPGQQARLTYVRDGQRVTVEVTFARPRSRH